MSAVLVVNSGSSSLKYQLIHTGSEKVLAEGLIERIGESGGPVADHKAAFAAVLEQNRNVLAEHPPIAVGHRVVQGGARFFEPTVITDLVKINIDELAALAPLHNPANLAGIDAAERAFPHVPHVAVFDTAFHQSMPPAAYTYAIDAAMAAKHRIRRYGFHGTSHEYVSRKAAAFLGRPVEDLAQIVLHLGNGASACAIDGGRSVETSMGMTPLEGLVMGTRSGDLDPAVLLHLQRRAGLDIDGVDELLNRRSGMLGLSGHQDMRDVTEAAAAGDEAAVLALDVYAHRIRGYIGAYAAQLGRLDDVVFTAGIGENSAVVRARVLDGLEILGIRLDPMRNAAPNDGPRLISTDDSTVAVLVVPTNEELEIARQTLGVVTH